MKQLKKILSVRRQQSTFIVHIKWVVVYGLKVQKHFKAVSDESDDLLNDTPPSSLKDGKIYFHGYSHSFLATKRCSPDMPIRSLY